LQGSFRESSSPFTSSHKKYDNTPLYINNNDFEMITDINDMCEDDDDMNLHKHLESGGSEESKKQIAMVRPQKMIVNSTDNLNDEISKLHNALINTDN
jgi:hypothetical protein